MQGPELDRREALAWLAATPLMLHGVPALANVPLDRLTVMYRKETAEAPNRLAPVVQHATLALEREFRQRGFRILQPAPEVYEMLERGPEVVITFAEDAGFSLLYSAYADVRPAPGQDAGTAEVRLAMRVFVGRHLLFADEGRGQVFTRLEPATRDFAVRRGLEVAAGRAAAAVAEKAVTELKALSPERITELVGAKPTSATTAQVVNVSGSMPVAAPAAPPAPAPAPGPAPANAAPAPAAAAAPTPAAPAQVAELTEHKTRRALVIGMSDYSRVRAAIGGDISDLPGVARDVRFVVDSLQKLGFARDKLTVLQDAEANGASVRLAFQRLAGQVGPEDLTLIFISGHGTDQDQGSSGFGMPVLADFNPRQGTALSYWELQSYAKNLPGRLVWINDTCHSGGAAKDVPSVVVSQRGITASKPVRGPDARTLATHAAPGQDYAILTACGPSEISWETGEGGLFTTKLFRELVAQRGKAPLAGVFAGGVHAHVVEQSKLSCKSGNQCAQHPQQTPMMAFNGRGDRIRL